MTEIPKTSDGLLRRAKQAREIAEKTKDPNIARNLIEYAEKCEAELRRLNGTFHK